MTQDKSVSLADDLRRGACGQECLCDEAAAQLDAMKECVEALKACADDYDDLIEETLRSVCPTHDGKPIREEAEPEDLEVVVNMEALRDRARSALANLEKADG